MKLLLITFSDSEINFQEELSKYISSRIANLQISEAVLENALDLPKKVADSKDDLIFISHFYAHDSMHLKIALEKTIDLELSGKKILKAIQKVDPDEFDENKDALAIKYGKMISKKLIGISD